MFKKFTQCGDPVFIDVNKIVSFRNYYKDKTEISALGGESIFVDESVDETISIIESCACVR